MLDVVTWRPRSTSTSPTCETALAEAYRVTRPGGRLLVLDTDWDSVVWHSTDPDRMRRILIRVGRTPGRSPPTPPAPGLLENSRIRGCHHRAAIPLLNVGYDEHTFSAGLIGFIESFVPGHAGVTEAETHAWSEGLVALGPDYFFSLNRYLFLAVK